MKGSVKFLSAVRNFVITLLIALLIFGLVAYGILEFATSAFITDDNGGETPQNTESVGTTDSGIDLPGGELDDVLGESFTVLFIGSDYQPGVYDDYEYADKTPDGFDGEVREIETDTLILVRINKETGECVFCPIPVVTEVKIDGHASTLEKLYSRKGIDALKEQVTALTGLPIDYHALVTIDGLISIIDTLGGIQFYVPVDMHYVDLEAELEINLKAGTQLLDGKKALDMLRYWSYPDEDTSRRKTAVEFLKAVISKVLTDIPMKDAAVAYTTYYQFIETNFTIEDLAAVADLIYAYPKMSIKDYTYPGKTTGEGGSAVFTPNITSAKEFFSQYKFKG